MRAKKGQNRTAEWPYVLGFSHALFEISYGIHKVPGRNENTALTSCVAVSRPIAERSRAEAINEVVKLPAHPLFTFEDSKKSVSARKFNLSKYLLSQDRIAHLFSVNKQSCLPKASLSHKLYF